MNQRIRLRPASLASPGSPAGSQMIPGWFPDDKGIRIEPGPFQQTPGGTNGAKDITKTIVIIVSFGWMYGICEIQKLWNTYKYCYFYDFCCFQKKPMCFISFNVIFDVQAFSLGTVDKTRKKLIPDDVGSMQCKRNLYSRMILYYRCWKNEVSGQPSRLATILFI